MGKQFTRELLSLENLKKRTALEYQLQYNHYPPIPLSFIPACEKAIECGMQCEWNDKWDALIDLPEEITYKSTGDTKAPASKIIEFAHLEEFIDLWGEEEEDNQTC